MSDETGPIDTDSPVTSSTVDDPKALLNRVSRERDKRFRDIIEALPIGVANASFDGRPLVSNPALQRLLGYSKDELASKVFSELTHPEDRARNVALHEELVAGKRDHFQLEKRYIRKDGQILWANTNVVMLRDSGGKAVSVLATVEDITPRKNALSALRRSEALLRSVAETSPSYIMQTDLEGRLLFINRTIPGLSPDEVIGRSVYDLAGPELASAMRACFARVISSGETDQYGGEHLGRHYLANVALVRDASNAVTGLTINSLDVTEYVEAQARLRTSEERLSLALNGIEEGLWDWPDLNDRAMWWAPRCYELLGHQPGEIAATMDTFHSLLHPVDLDLVIEASIKQIKERVPYDVEVRMRCQDGVYRWFRSRGIAVRDEVGRAHRMVGILQSIDVRKTAEMGLRARERQQAAIARLGQEALDGLDVSELLRSAVAAVADTLDVEFVKVLELTRGGDELLLAAGVGWKPGLVGIGRVGSGKDSQAGYTLASSEPVIVDDLRTESRFSGPRLLIEHGVISGLSVAIKGSRGPHGVLGAHTAALRTFTEDDMHFMRSAANVLSAAIQRSERETLLRVSRDAIRTLGAEREQAREDERARVSRELHDELGQVLTSLKMDLSWLREQLPSADREAVQRADESLELVQSTVESVRRIARELRPGVLDNLGLEAAIHWQVQELERRAAIQVRLEGERVPVLEDTRSTAVFRVLQEALTNVLRHAEARSVTVRYGVDEEWFTLEVVDDGRGSALNEETLASGIGLRGMIERAEVLGAILTLTSSEGEGMSIRLRLPSGSLAERSNAH